MNSVSAPVRRKDPEKIIDLLDRAAEDYPDNGLDIYGNNLDKGYQTRLTYGELKKTATEKAKLLEQNFGDQKPCIILIHFDDHYDSIVWFWAVTMAGFTPALSPPLVHNTEQRRAHLTHLQSLLHDPILLTREYALGEFKLADKLRLCSIESLENNTVSVASSLHGSFQTPDDLAALVLTSGSSGASKAVCLEHQQIFSAIEGKQMHSGTAKDDVFFNWVGLDHAVNLVEIHLQAMELGSNQVHVLARDLLQDPVAFIKLIDRHRVAFTFAPNFFLSLLEQKLEEVGDDITKMNYDISSLKGVFSGGEANVTQMCLSLLDKLTKHFNSKRSVIRPGYGLSETCAGVTWSQYFPEHDVKYENEFASLGTGTPAVNWRIVTDEGKPAKAFEIGDLHLTGPAVLKQYFNNTNANETSFTKDNWFITGDRGFFDKEGFLNITGRSKEIIIINGIHFPPIEIEAAIEGAGIPGVNPTFTAVFPYRPKGAATETYVVLYNPTYADDNVPMKVETVDAISRICSIAVNTKPYRIVPLPESMLPKSSIGKLSRAKLRTAYEKGDFDKNAEENEQAVDKYRRDTRKPPSTDADNTVLEATCEVLGLNPEMVSMTDSVFDLGLSSLTLFTYVKTMQSRFGFDNQLSAPDLLATVTLEGIAKFLSKTDGQSVYDPVVPLQTKGSGTPIWFVHPASGNVLAFIPISGYFIDRPVYALRASGLNPGEGFFKTIYEMADYYYQSMRRVQPKGPYAIAGYSLGSTVGYEIAKLIERDGDEIKFLACIDSPPRIAELVKPLTWPICLVMVSYFLLLIPESTCLELMETAESWETDKLLEHILSVSSQSQLKALGLDGKSLAAVADVAHSYGVSARDYECVSTVDKIDVFWATPLASVSNSRRDWYENFLIQWKDFSRQNVDFYECEGEHANMLNTEHVFSFQKKFREVMKMRGL